MFGKIKDKLKSVFLKSEEVIEESEDSVEEIVEEDLSDVPKPSIKKEEPKEKKKPEFKKSPKKETEEKSKPKKKVVYKEKITETPLTEEEIEKPIEEIPKEEITEPEVDEKVEDIEEPKKKGFLSKLFGKKEDEESQVEIKEDNPDESEEPVEEKESKSLDEEKEGLIGKTFTKLKAKKITEDDFEKIWVELQIFLLEINIAFEIVTKIEEKLRKELIGNSFNRFKLSEKIRHVLESEVELVLKDREANFLKELNKIKERDGLVKILILGVNGTGKTTTIAKIVNYFQKNNLTCVVAAADTFRAAATEQLEEHSQKLGFKLIVHKGGSDPAAVAFDSIEHAKAKKLDVVLIDTAGRMPNNSNLMIELQKIKKVSNSQMAVFVGDSISGNDLIDQINLFNEGIDIDGVILTKVDTDERPGSVVTTAYSIDKPIYFLGIGQTYDDLVVFNSKDVAKKLFEIENDE